MIKLKVNGDEEFQVRIGKADKIIATRISYSKTKHLASGWTFHDLNNSEDRKRLMNIIVRELDLSK